MDVSSIASVKSEFNMLLEVGTFKSPMAGETADTANMLAKIVDVLDMNPTQDIIRTWILNNYAALGALVASLNPDQRDQRILEIATLSNKKAEEHLLYSTEDGKYLISAQVLIANTIPNSPNGNRNLTKEVLAKRYAKLSNLMWEQLMDELGKRADIRGYFGASISSNIVLTLANRRTAAETKYLSDQDIEILQKIATEINAMYGTDKDQNDGERYNQILNLPKEDLVEVITSMNTIAREASKKKIASCLKMFDKYSTQNRLVTEKHTGVHGALSKDFANVELGPELRSLATVVAQYNDASNYFLAVDAAESKEFCKHAYRDGSEPDCSTTVKRLHVYARKIQEAADTCNNVIEAGEKANLKERYANGKSTGLFDRGRGWFHSR